MTIAELGPDQLARRCDPAQFNFSSTTELPVVPDIIGQPRATHAIEFGIDIASPGYNIFVLGPAGSGRATAIRRFLTRRAENGRVPDDWVYVHNFIEPYKPRAICLPPGLGKKLAQDMQRLVWRLQTDLPRAFETAEYENARTRIWRAFEQVRNEQFGRIDAQARQKGLTLVRTPTGLAFVPLVNGQVVEPDAMPPLSDEQQRQLEAAQVELEDALNRAMRIVREQDKAARAQLQELDRQVAAYSIEYLIEEIRQRYECCPEVGEYLQEVYEDIITNVEEFKSSVASESSSEGGEKAQPPVSARYLVNVLVDNSNQTGAPVVLETNPTFSNLMGRIEHDVRLGGTVTDFTMLRPGALHRANGGYLVLRARDLLNSQDAYEALKRALSSGVVAIEDRGVQMQSVSIKTLEPEPIPLQVKVVLWGSPTLYYSLYAADEDFRKLFKVKADFAADMERTPENELAYALFIRARCAEEGLRDFDPTGVAALIELGSRLAEDQHKLSTRFGDVADIIREASYWAGKVGQPLVTAEAVHRAICEWRYRSNQVEEQLRKDMLNGTLMIDTSGAIVGQVNGLTVTSMGDYDFGQPSRITARTFVGRAGLVSIEREVKMSGRIYNKGVLILQGYMGGQYATERPLTLSASLGFEQLYSDVDGDSAASAELYALLSSLADLPVRQSIAVTGSVNQRGELQPVGGVHYKIEGFFDLCAARGLTGEQGVIIPHQNRRMLMLRPDVVQAVAEGKFHVWAIHTIDEGIELLTGVPAGVRGPDGYYPEGTVHARVEDKLRQLAENVDKKPSDKPNSEAAKSA